MKCLTKKNEMKKLELFLIAFLFAAVSFAQQNYYYTDHQKVYFSNDSSSINILVANMTNYDPIRQNLETLFNSSNDEVIYSAEDRNIIVNSPDITNYTLKNIVTRVQVNNGDIFYIDYGKTLVSNNASVWFTNCVLMKLDSKYTINDASVIINNYTTDSIINDNGYWYSIYCESRDDVILLANELEESKYAIYAAPNKYSDNALMVNDPKFSNQYYMKNTGQYISALPTSDSGNGDPGIDINILNAWNLTTGSSTIKVAVIDDGVEDHSDLKDGNGNSRVITGYAPTFLGWGNNDGSPEPNGAHGQACAGIIGASHNYEGIAGIAPNVKIVPIRIFKNSGGSFSDKNIAKAINYAWEDLGCDVLSNSWGSYGTSDVITEAFEEALTYGRNGKGCVVVAASGNANNIVLFPASIPDVISVGAINKNGDRSTYACYGDNLDVVAPSGNHTGANAGDVRTIDRAGSSGYTTNSTYDYFSGTSAACPQVAGVSALILSKNPNMNSDEVKDIIESSCTKVAGYTFTTNSSHPNGTWNNELGHGIVNTTKTVLEGMFYYSGINGNSTITACNEATFTYSATIPAGIVIEWETSENVEIVSGQNTSSITVLPIGNGSGFVKIKLFSGATFVNKVFPFTVQGGYSYPIVRGENLYSSQTYSTPRIISETLTVKPNSVLTVNSTLYCSPSAEIVVEPGAKIIVDAGTITNLCDDYLWEGISLVGNKNQTQTEQNQGSAELKNNSVIEFANDAISTWDGSDYNSTGGIIKASNTTFRNNRRAIEFMSYKNMNGTIEMSNVSFFTKCTFTIDNNNNLSQAGTSFGAHVTMWDVNRISFKGCAFENITSYNGVDRGKAIAGAGAGFIVTESCPGIYLSSTCECTLTPTPSSFNGFETAINASNTGSNYSINVQRSTFENSRICINADAVNDAQITMCDFDMDVNGLFSSSAVRGIVFVNSSGYKIEENYFHTPYTTIPSGFTSIGVSITNSGVAENIVYRNEFQNLVGAIYAQGTNGQWSGSYPGLQFQCNEFDNIYHDIYVDGVVKKYQGTASKGADNKFLNQVYDQVEHYNNNNNLEYYYSNALNHTPTSTVHTNLHNNAIANSCGSTLCNFGIIIKKSTNSDTLYNENSDLETYEILEAQFQELLSLLDEDSITMGGTIDKTTLDTTTIFESLNELGRLMADISVSNIQYLLFDTVEFDHQLLTSWYDQINTPIAKYQLINSYSERGEYIRAQNIYDSIPIIFPLDSLAMIEYNAYGIYMNLREVVYTSGRTWAELLESEINILQLLTSGIYGNGFTFSLANSIQCFFYGNCIDLELNDSYVENTATDKSREFDNDISRGIKENEIVFDVYPNPADDKLMINVNCENYSVELVSVLGTVVLQENKPQVLNLSQLPSGIYVLKLKVDEAVYQQKLIIE
jgi:serine protease